MAGIETILKAADLIAEIRRAFVKIENLEAGQKQLTEVLGTLDKRVRELEAGLREARSEIKLEAVKETQSILNSVQGRMYQEIKDVSIALDRIRRTASDSPGASHAMIEKPGETRSAAILSLLRSVTVPAPPVPYPKNPAAGRYSR